VPENASIARIAPAAARRRRFGGEARGEVSARVFFAVASSDAVRWSRSPKFSAQDRANRPAPKNKLQRRVVCSACWRNVFAIRRCISAIYIARGLYSASVRDALRRFAYVHESLLVLTSADRMEQV
jgi:hypothetical protein